MEVRAFIKGNSVKRAANQTNMLANIAHQQCWPTMLVWFAVPTNMLVKEKIVKKCWPTFINFLINVGQHCWSRCMLVWFAVPANMLANMLANIRIFLVELSCLGELYSNVFQIF